MILNFMFGLYYLSIYFSYLTKTYPSPLNTSLFLLEHSSFSYMVSGYA